MLRKETRLRGETRHSGMLASVRFAVTRFDRLRGLFAYPHYYGLLVLVPCRSIHTYGMKKPIQVAFINKEGMVLEADPFVLPGTVLGKRDAVAVIERRINETQSQTRQCKWFQAGEIIALDTTFKKGLPHD